MKFDRFQRRKLFSHSMTVLSGLTIVVILIPLIAVIYEAASLGYSSFSPGFFTQSFPLPCTAQTGVTCAKGGIAPAIQGTLILIGMASLLALPIGIGAAIFAVEFGGQSLLARAISTVADVLSGVPSILAGVFAYSLFLQYNRQLVFSTYSEALALGILMIPIVTRASEEALRTVPQSTREAALALGIPRWRTSIQIVLVTALPGVITGALLSIARAAGEAAPLLLTSVFSLHGFTNFNNSVDAMPLWIFYAATSPYGNWQAIAWGTAFLLILMILAISLISRFVLNRMIRRARGG
jgi:phosphate transport system permease protein